jgi:carotenoid cleavage dioxygenase-like enzyme
MICRFAIRNGGVHFQNTFVKTKWCDPPACDDRLLCAPNLRAATQPTARQASDNRVSPVQYLSNTRVRSAQ